MNLIVALLNCPHSYIVCFEFLVLEWGNELISENDNAKFGFKALGVAIGERLCIFEFVWVMQHKASSKLEYVNENKVTSSLLLSIVATTE